MVTTPRTPIRTDRLRSLNVPREVHVEVDRGGQGGTGAGEGGKGWEQTVGSGKTQGSGLTAQRKGGKEREEAGRSGRTHDAHGSRLTAYGSTTDIPNRVQLDGLVRSIITIREMWEIEDEWWRDHIARRYFDVVLEGGKHLVLYQNRLTGKWFVQFP